MDKNLLKNKAKKTRIHLLISLLKLKAIKKTGDSETDEIVEALKKEIQNYRKLSWGEIDKAIQRYFSFTLTEYVEMIKGCENNLNALLDVVMDFKREYAAEKKKRQFS